MACCPKCVRFGVRIISEERFPPCHDVPMQAGRRVAHNVPREYREGGVAGDDVRE